MANQPILVLIVDDDPSVGAWLQLLVRRMGDTLPCTATWVTSGAVAMEEMAKTHYDLMFLDYHLQDIDGLTVLSNVTQKPKEEQPAVIMLTGGGSEKIAVEAMKRGARDYLIKGNLDQGTLRRTMSAALETRRLEAALARYTAELKVKNEQMEAELSMAMEVQQALLPQQYPQIPAGAAPGESLVFSHLWIPSSGMAGDFFEILPLSQTHAGIFLCDVMGHGVRAALVTALIRGLLKETSPHAMDPGAFLKDLNHDLMEILQRSNNVLFATAVYMVVDTQHQEVRMANAGHPHPLILNRAAGTVSLWEGSEGPGPALGLLPDSEYQVCSMPMVKESGIMLYTDGLYEAENAEGEAFGMERLCETTRLLLSKPGPEIYKGLLDELRQFLAVDEKTMMADDICIAGVRFPGEGSTFAGEFL